VASGHPLLISLGSPGKWDEQVAGGKASKLVQLSVADFEVPKVLPDDLGLLNSRI
jgi:hypothetical protein